MGSLERLPKGAVEPAHESGIVGNERSFTDGVVQDLRNQDWAVEKETIFGPVAIDILAKKPGGSKAYAIEVKFGENKDTHFSALAEIKNAARGAERDADVDNVIPVLVTNYEVSPAIQQAADIVGVDIVKVLGSVSDSTKAVVNYLLSRETVERNSEKPAGHEEQ